MVGDGIGGADQLNTVTDHIQNPAAANARCCSLIAELDRHLDGNHRSCDNSQEIHVKRSFAHRVELEVTGDCFDLIAVDINGGDGGHKAASMDFEIDLAIRKIDGDGG